MKRFRPSIVKLFCLRAMFQEVVKLHLCFVSLSSIVLMDRRFSLVTSSFAQPLSSANVQCISMMIVFTKLWLVGLPCV